MSYCACTFVSEGGSPRLHVLSDLQHHDLPNPLPGQCSDLLREVLHLVLSQALRLLQLQVRGAGGRGGGGGRGEEEEGGGRKDFHYKL